VKVLNVSKNELVTLPYLSHHLQYLDVSYNMYLHELPELPEGLEVLRASNCALTALPALPQSLRYLYVNNNYLTELPELPPGLEVLYIFNNCIKNLTMLPKTIQKCIADPQMT